MNPQSIITASNTTKYPLLVQKVLHTTGYWTGKRFVISFTLNNKIYDDFGGYGCEKYIQNQYRMHAVTKCLKIWKEYGEKITKELVSKIDHLVRHYGYDLETDW